MPALLDVYGIAYTFSDPLVMALTLHKGLTKTVVAAGGVPTPRFAVVENARRCRCASICPFRCLPNRWPKAPARASRRHRRSNNQAALQAVCEPAAGRVPATGAGRDLLAGPRVHRRHHGHRRRKPRRCGHAGNRAARKAPRPTPIPTSTRNAARSWSNTAWSTPTATSRSARPKQVALTAWRILGCRDAGRVDLRCDAAGAAELHGGQSAGGACTPSIPICRSWRRKSACLRRADPADRRQRRAAGRGSQAARKPGGFAA